MIEVDRLMMEEYRIGLLQMMENAGRELASLAVRRFLENEPNGRRVTVLAGTGGNGGGALVCARSLHSRGAVVRVYLAAENDSDMKPVPRQQLETLRRMGVKTGKAADLKNAHPAHLVIDGVLGYSLSGKPRGAAKVMIEWANRQIGAVLSLDTPSGLDLTTGKAYRPAIQADATMTLALPKRGLFYKKAMPYRGELWLADIGVPPELYAEPSLRLNVEHSLFAKSGIVKLAGRPVCPVSDTPGIPARNGVRISAR